MQKNEAELAAIVKKALPYLDRKLKEDYDDLVKSKADLNKQHPSYLQVHIYTCAVFSGI